MVHIVYLSDKYINSSTVQNNYSVKKPKSTLFFFNICTLPNKNNNSWILLICILQFYNLLTEVLKMNPHDN